MPLDLALTNYNQHTGRYNFAKGANGDVAFDATQAYAVMSSALCIQGAWWADAGHGSTLSLLRNLTARTPSQAEASVLDSQLPLEQQNLIVNPQATAVRDSTPGFGNRLAVDLTWNTPGGARQSRRIVQG